MSVRVQIRGASPDEIANWEALLDWKNETLDAERAGLPIPPVPKARFEALLQVVER